MFRIDRAALDRAVATPCYAATPATVATPATNAAETVAVVAGVAAVAVDCSVASVATVAAVAGVAASQPSEAVSAPADPDRWCWPHDPDPGTAMNASEVETFVSRTLVFMGRGLNLRQAEKLADRLKIRDREADNRRACIECRHLTTSRNCTAWRQAELGGTQVGPLVAKLQRCPAFRRQ